MADESIKQMLQNAPPVKVSRSNDIMALRGILGELNNPNLTGAVVPPEEKEAMEKILSSSPELPSPLPTAPHEPEPALTAPRAALNKIFLTGRAGGPEQVAGAVGINLRTLVENQVKELFGFTPTPALLSEYQAWASGTVNPQYPQTLSRALLESLVRSKQPGFGSAEYLLSLAKVRAEALAAQGKLAIIIGVDSVPGFKLLQRNGYTHFHVMMSNATASNRPSSPNAVSDAMDNDVIKKISFQRDGKRLRVIWLDSQPAPSNRFYSLQDFQRELATAEVGQELSVS